MHIALVDPSSTVRSAVTSLLQERGHVVFGFRDPIEALDRIKTDLKISAVITSTILTPMSGVEFCWEVRLLAQGQRAIYILLMSSNFNERAIAEALDVGADDLIAKPPGKEELYARLRSGERIVKLQRELIALAFTDPLTGVLNRRAFFEHANEILLRPRGRNHLCAIVLDIDHFKEINDFYGHYIGDESLRAIAGEAQRDQAIVGRLGGDEFCILLDGVSLSTAWDAAEDLRHRISELQIKSSGGIIKVTCSLGVGELHPGETIDDVIRSADVALYRAKREGRDCVSTPPPSDWVKANPAQTSTVARSRVRRPNTRAS